MIYIKLKTIDQKSILEINDFGDVKILPFKPYNSNEGGGYKFIFDYHENTLKIVLGVLIGEEKIILKESKTEDLFWIFENNGEVFETDGFYGIVDLNRIRKVYQDYYLKIPKLSDNSNITSP